MNRVLLLLSVFFISNTCSAQKNPTWIYGTVRIGDNLSVKATEVSLAEWMGFIINNNFDSSLFPDIKCLSPTSSLLFQDLKKGHDFKYLVILNNSGVEKMYFGDKRFGLNDNFKELFINNTDYFQTEMPITGITFTQVEKYCIWKENLVNASRVIKIRISLPSIEMYKNMITNKDSLDDKDRYQYNCVSARCYCDTKDNFIKAQGHFLVRRDAYKPTKSGLYNLQGNAAEMTSVEGISMGGSFKDFARQSYNDQKQSYSKAENWLGFRYVVTLL